MPLISQGFQYGGPTQQDDDNERFGRQVGMQQMQAGQQSQRDAAVMAAQERLQTMALNSQRELQGTFGQKSAQDLAMERERGGTQIGVAALGSQPGLESVRGRNQQADREWQAGGVGRQVTDARGQMALDALKGGAGAPAPGGDGAFGGMDPMKLIAMGANPADVMRGFADSNKLQRDDQNQMLQLAVQLASSGRPEARALAGQLLAKNRQFAGMDGSQVAAGLSPERTAADLSTDAVFSQGVQELRGLANKLSPSAFNPVGTVRMGLRGPEMRQEFAQRMQQLQKYAVEKNVSPEQFSAYLKQALGPTTDSGVLDMFGVNPGKQALGIPQ